MIESQTLTIQLNCCFYIFLEELLQNPTPSHMTRRPSIQLSDSQHSFSNHLEQSEQALAAQSSITRSIHKTSKPHLSYHKQQIATDDYCIVQLQNQDQIQDNYQNLAVSKINDLRLRVASVQKNRSEQCKKIVKTITIPLCLQKQQTPLVRIHHQHIIKNCQRVQLRYPHFLNNQQDKPRSLTLDFKRALSVHTATNHTKISSKQKTKNTRLNIPILPKNISKSTQPKKIDKLLSQENQFLPQKYNQPYRIIGQFNLRTQAYSQDKAKNCMLQSRIKLKMIKFQPRPLQERKNSNNKNHEHIQKQDKDRPKLAKLEKELRKSRSNSFTSKTNEVVLTPQLIDLRNRAKNSPAKTPHQQMAVFKSKLHAKGNRKLIL